MQLRFWEHQARPRLAERRPDYAAEARRAFGSHRGAGANVDGLRPT